MLISEFPSSAVQAVPILVNAKSGAGHSSTQKEELEQAFAEAGMRAEVLLIQPGEDVQAAVRKAIEAHPPVLVAGGGDGTLNAVADVLRGTDTALGILPLGTLNHFAKDLGIPLDLPGAVRTIAQGKRAAVDVGEVNGACFINNSSLGIYPDIVRERTRQQQRLGRSKWSAMLWATLAVLGRTPLLDLRMRLDGENGGHQACRAPFVFIGNNPYLFEGFDIGKRERLDTGHLSVYTTKRCGGAGLVSLALRALLGRLRQADDFSVTNTASLHIESRKARIRVATDGEVRVMEAPLEYKILRGALKVIVP